MPVSDKSKEIVNKFCEYIRSGNKTLIAAYSIEELKRAKYEYSVDSCREFYKAIEDRIKEIEKFIDETRKSKEKRVDRIITFILGVLAGLIIAYLKGCFKLRPLKKSEKIVFLSFTLRPAVCKTFANPHLTVFRSLYPVVSYCNPPHIDFRRRSAMIAQLYHAFDVNAYRGHVNLDACFG